MKKFIRLLTKRRNHGFTLVEMIVSIALLAVLLGGMMIFITPILASYNNNQTLYTAENVSTAMQEYITHSLRNAYQVNIFTNANYDSNATADVTDKVSPMATYVNGKNGAGTTSANRLYELKCLSLRYNDGKYILCNETVDVSVTSGSYLSGNDDNKNLQTANKAFSDVLYDNLYMDFTFALPDEDPDEAVEKLSKDTLELTIKSYTDKDKKNLVFFGTGLSEFYAIKTMLRSKAPEAEYYVKINELTPTEGNNDIYIYYVTRKLKGVGTKTT